ncbi:hypothetical protein E3N88_29029 [Mikania micrantha]|uniref:Uncharacterized protein n=1 Tax=Mikania micrantha TaxID=192012 RepID=A0A5N6N1H6_9ASTR|nr:hypothetical protein E3N88_29029 [Mikania micrantha]
MWCVLSTSANLGQGSAKFLAAQGSADFGSNKGLPAWDGSALHGFGIHERFLTMQRFGDMVEVRRSGGFAACKKDRPEMLGVRLHHVGSAG